MLFRSSSARGHHRLADADGPGPRSHATGGRVVPSDWRATQGTCRSRAARPGPASPVSPWSAACEPRRYRAAAQQSPTIRKRHLCVLPRRRGTERSGRGRGPERPFDDRAIEYIRAYAQNGTFGLCGTERMPGIWGAHSGTIVWVQSKASVPTLPARVPSSERRVPE